MEGRAGSVEGREGGRCIPLSRQNHKVGGVGQEADDPEILNGSRK